MRIVVTGLLIAVFVALLVTSEAQENWYRLERVDAHDADTVKADVIFPWGVTLREQAIRLHGADAYEVTRTRRTVGNITDEEIRKGKKALAEFQALLAKGRLEVSPLTYEGTDSVYGRIEARWRIVHPDGTTTDVAAWIKARGHERGPIK
jgi:hypothetical protein